MRTTGLIGWLLPLLALIAGLTPAEAAEWPDLSAPAPAEGGGENDAAIIIGIENYTYVDDIPGAIQNANDWYSWLTRTRKVPLGRVALLRDNDGTREGILSTILTTASKVGPGSTLWLVFIGHGAPSKDGNDGLLLGVDTMQTADSVYARGLPQSELFEALGQGTQEQTIVVLDACFSGKSGLGDALVDGLMPLVPSYAVQASEVTVLSAGQGDQFAGPLPGIARPAFSYLLLGGLRGWADADADSQVTPNEAMSYTNDAMYALLRDRTQTPQLHGPGGDRVLSQGHEQGPDLASMVLTLGSTSGVSAGAATVNTGTSVDFQRQLAELEQKRRERDRLEQEEAELQRKIDEDRQQRREAAKASLLESAQQDWLALTTFLETESPEAVAAAEMYVEKYGEASVTIDGNGTPVEIAFVDDAREWLRTHASRVLGVGALGGRVTDAHGYEMVRIEAGEFLMGSPDSEEGRYEDEIQHRVLITEPFLMGTTEVTQEFWEAVTGENPAITRQMYWRGETHGKCNEHHGVSLVDPTLPVHCVDWFDVLRFCNQLSELEGLEPVYRISGEEVMWDQAANGYRLPTEAEWEYAARAGSSDRYSGTDSDDAACEIGNVEDATYSSVLPDAANLFACSDGFLASAPPRSYRANDFGLYDMTGNVREWVWDWYGEYAEGIATDPTGPSTGIHRVMRGGSCQFYPRYARIAFRVSHAADVRFTDLGFRLVRSIE